MIDVLLALLFIFVGIFIQWFWTWKICVPSCDRCQAKAHPHISQALIRANHRADKAEAVRDDILEECAKIAEDGWFEFSTRHDIAAAIRNLKRSQPQGDR